jgi:hypothetical protein
MTSLNLDKTGKKDLWFQKLIYDLEYFISVLFQHEFDLIEEEQELRPLWPVWMKCLFIHHSGDFVLRQRF